MKEFNLKQAKAGKPVCTKTGRPARIICFDRKGVSPIVALIEIERGNEGMFTFLPNGKYLENDDSYLDLMMASVKKEGWINILHSIDEGYTTVEDNVYNNEEDAKKVNYQHFEKIATIKIEWEE